MDKAKKDFFISYNKADRAWAEWIAWQLEEAEYSAVIQAWDFRPGSNFVLEMQGAATEAERTIAVFSPDYLTALYTQPEWASAFAQDPTGEKGVLLPVRVRECEIKGLLKPMIYIDLFSLNDEQAAKKALLAGVKRGRAKPASKPDFPGAPTRAKTDKPRFPGSLPPVWNIPHYRNPNFTGREEILAALRNSLESGQAAALTQAIHGMGGVGKTQLAVEYSYRFGSAYNVVWWVKSEEPVTLAADYAALSTGLGLPEKDAKDQKIIVEAVKEWLRANDRWLLIFDNAVDAKSVRDYFPRGGRGHIIVTSRDANWGGVARPLPVKVLPRDEAIEFILKRTGKADKESADALAEALGCLPLALEQACAYIEATGNSIKQYLDLFRKHHKKLLSLGEPSSYDRDTVATTWDISFRQVKREAPAAVDLMNLCAFLAPDDIPLDLLSKGANKLPERLAKALTDQILLNDAIAALRRYSLVEVKDQEISIHRLVQLVTQHKMKANDFRKWSTAALQVVNAVFPLESHDFRTWSDCSRLLNHALAVLPESEAVKSSSKEASRLLNQCGTYLFGRAEYKQARSLFERALAIGEAALGPSHPNVAIRLNNLGGVLKSLGDLAAAKAHFERALAIGEAALGPNHPDVAIRLSNLGSVLESLGDLAAAKAHFERALAIGEAALGPSHPNVAIRLNNLGGVLKSLGDLAAAKAHFERALAIGESAFGSDHPQVAIFANNLGSVLESLGDLAAAKAHFERALAIDEAALGPSHPNVAIRLSNLGLVLKSLGDLAAAKAHFERALAIGESAFGSDHPQVAIFANNLGSVLESLGDLAAAKAHFERALAIDEAALGPSHPNVAIRLSNLGLVLKSLGDLAAAKAHFERALAIGESAFGSDHPQVAIFANNLGGVLESLGDLAAAKAHYERALTIDEAVYGSNHPDVAIDLNNLGSVLKSLGDLAAAKAHFERALAIFRKSLGEDHPNTITVRENLELLNG